MNTTIKLATVLIGLLYVCISLYNKTWDAMCWSQDSVVTFTIVGFALLAVSATLAWAIGASKDLEKELEKLDKERKDIIKRL